MGKDTNRFQVLQLNSVIYRGRIQLKATGRQVCNVSASDCILIRILCDNLQRRESIKLYPYKLGTSHLAKSVKGTVKGYKFKHGRGIFDRGNRL